MTYAVSDIHGCYDKYIDLLRKISFGPHDTLYVLGDVIDRGPDGFKILLDMAQRSNMINLLGNHEAMAIDTLPRMLRSVQPDGSVELSEEDAKAVERLFYNGGELSLADFLWLNKGQMQIVWNYLLKMPLYQEVNVGGRQFILVHGGLENFSPSRPLESYTPDEILWCRPESDTVYYEDKIVIFGHTPVQFLGPDTPAKIYRRGSLIDIDCGCAFPGGRLGCLCLDTLEEIYV